MNAQRQKTAEYEYIPVPVPVEFNELPPAQKSRLRKFAAHKARTVTLVTWIKGNVILHKGDAVYNPQKLQRLENCGTILQFRNYFSLNPPLVVLADINACKQSLLCPHCAIRRAAKAVRTYWEKYQTLRKENPNLRLYYLVLTVKNGPDLNKTFALVEKAVRNLIERRKNAKLARNGNKSMRYALNSAFADVEAGAYSFEVKRGKGSGLWHPHVNVLLLSEGTIDERALREEWRNLTNGSYITHLKAVEKDDKGAFLEIFKYALKFSEMAAGDTFHAATALYRRNLFGSFGAFRGLKVENEDTLEVKDLPYIDMFYRINAAMNDYDLFRLNTENANKGKEGTVCTTVKEGGVCECATA